MGQLTDKRRMQAAEADALFAVICNRSAAMAGIDDPMAYRKAVQALLHEAHRFLANEADDDFDLRRTWRELWLMEERARESQTRAEREAMEADPDAA